MLINLQSCKPVYRDESHIEQAIAIPLFMQDVVYLKFPAKVINVHGNPSINKEGKEYVLISENEVLESGAIVVVNASESVGILQGNGEVLKLESGTYVIRKK
jgi:hypothetical protein